MSQRPAKPKVPRGVEARWHAGRAVWTFRVRWTDPVSGERRSQEFDTVDDALDYQAYLRLARRRGALDELSRGRVVLSEFVEDDWWPNHAGRRLSRHTLNAYSQVWNRHLVPRVGHLELRELTTPTVQTLREALEADGVGPATVRKSLAVLQSICAHAVRKGEVTINPVSAVRKPAAKRSMVIDPFSVEEVEALIGALRDRASHPASGCSPSSSPTQAHGRRMRSRCSTDGSARKRIVYAEKNVDGRIVAGSKTGEDRDAVGHAPRARCARTSWPSGSPPATRRTTRSCCRRRQGKPWRLHDYKNWQRNAVKTERSRAPPAFSPRPRRPSEDPTRRPTSSATPTPASASPSSVSPSRRSPRRWATPSRSSRARTRTSSPSTAARAPSTPRRSSTRRGASRETPQKRPKPHHQQLELLKPTGGLEPPTPSLRVMCSTS